MLSTIIFAPQSMSAQKQFTLEDLNYGGNNFHNMVPKNRYTAWWGDQLVRTDAEFCALIDKNTGKETRLFSVDDINKWVASIGNIKVHSLYHATFPYPNQQLVLLNTSKMRMLVNWKTKQVVWKQDAKDENFADWNAQSRAVAFVKGDNLYVNNAQGTLKQLTKDGSRDIVYGQSVHRDEFGIYKGTFWSNDGQKLAFYRMDQSMVADYPLVDIDTRIATETPVRYPMAGEKSHLVTVGIYDLNTDKTVYLNTGDPTDRYFTNIAWAPDGKLIYLIELNRAQNRYSLDAYDPATGNKTATLYTESSDKYVHPMHAITFLPWDKTRFILQSEKDGYNHLYLFDTSGKQIKQLTTGKWIVVDLLGFNAKTKEAIILSTEASPIQNNLYAVNLQTGARRLLDNGKGCHANTTGEGGSHKPALSLSGQWILDSYTEPTVPRNIDIVNVASAKATRYFTAENPWVGYTVPEYTCGKIKAADGTTDLYYRMVKPTNFDPNKKYPTIIYVYGGPGVRNVEARWHYWSRGWETYMAQKGYLLFILDNRGSSARGLAFEQATFHHLGVEEAKDQMKGVEYLTSNKVDIILANFTVTPARAEVVDFAKPYMKVALGVVSKDGAVITDVNQLKGKTLLINKGTTADAYFTKNYPDIKLLKFEQNTETFEALRDGRGDALAHDNTLLFAWAKENPGFTVGVKNLGDQDFIAPAVRKGDTELLNWLNAEIEKLGKQGVLKQAYEKTLKPIYGDAITEADVVVEYK